MTRRCPARSRSKDRHLPAQGSGSTASILTDICRGASVWPASGGSRVERAKVLRAVGLCSRPDGCAASGCRLGVLCGRGRALSGGRWRPSVRRDQLRRCPRPLLCGWRSIRFTASAKHKLEQRSSQRFLAVAVDRLAPRRDIGLDRTDPARGQRDRGGRGTGAEHRSRTCHRESGWELVAGGGAQAWEPTHSP